MSKGLDAAAAAEARRLRTTLSRIIIYGAPCFAAATSVSLFWLTRSTPAPLNSFGGPIFLFNAALAVIAASCATIFLGGGQRLRLVGAFAYGILALLVYMILTVTGIEVAGR